MSKNFLCGLRIFRYESQNDTVSRSPSASLLVVTLLTVLQIELDKTNGNLWYSVRNEGNGNIYLFVFFIATLYC